MGLTGKQDKFVTEYLKDLNATQAAIRAGYSKKTARIIAAQNLSKVNIQAAIEAGQARRRHRMDVSVDSVVAELAKLGFYDIRKAVEWGNVPEMDGDGEIQSYPVKLVPSDDVDDDTAAAITEVSLTRDGVKVKLADKRAALESLLKHLSAVPNGGEDAEPIPYKIGRAEPVSNVRVTRPNS